ncbi:MAG TPA: permease-like cell division protein FtsX [Candidatus Evtepia faecigallinarum]|nr:permease-like cell division protein FtsX [Candidatus Evtepia faecigallinarum]
MRDKQIFYHIREGFRSIFTHGLMSFAAVCMTVACLLIMGSFSLIAVNANQMLKDLEDDNQFLAYVDDSLTREQGQALEAKIKAVPNVASVTFVTKEEAWDSFTAEQDNQAVFSDEDADILRDRYEIHVEDIQLMEQTVKQVADISGIANVRAAMEIADGFVMLRNVATALAIILVVMLVIISISIVANTIKLATFTRREEIAIMKMCGATNWFVRWPFLVEGMILGLAGGVIAYLCQWGVYGLVVQAVNRSGILNIIDIVPFAQMSQLVLLVFLLVGIAIGAGGSVMAIRKFLKV